MAKLDAIIDNKILQNIFVWLCFFLILLGAVQAENKLLSILVIIGFMAPCIYINNLFVLPYFHKNRRHFLMLFLGNSLVFTAIAEYALRSSLGISFQWKVFLTFLGVVILTITCGMAIRMARDSFYRRQQVKDAELKLLKGQLNPHFLFNTLNNLYGLSVLKSDKLPGLMLQLSDLLRYSLYETKDAFVPLRKEIQYLENYVALEQIRLEQTQIDLEITGEITDQQIAPMLLIVFVENAFKHLGGSQSRVKILVTITQNKLEFICENTMDKLVNSTENIEASNKGIGLENAKKRLDLIYPNKHKLQVEKQPAIFSVTLSIVLS